MNRQNYLKSREIYQNENLSWKDKFHKVYKLIRGVQYKEEKETTEEQYKEALEIWLEQTDEYLTKCEENVKNAESDLKQLRELFVQSQN